MSDKLTNDYIIFRKSKNYFKKSKDESSEYSLE